MSAKAEAFAASAEALVGKPFRLRGRSPEYGLDCVGLAYHALGAARQAALRPPSYGLRNLSYEFVPCFAENCGFSLVSETAILRGDLLAVQPGPAQLHLLIASTARTFIHAHAGLRRVTIMNGPIDWPTLYHFRLSEKS